MTTKCLNVYWLWAYVQYVRGSNKLWHGITLCAHRPASHEPGDGSREEILIVDADVARHVRVSLPEDLRHGLELGAHLDEAVQLDARSHAWHGEAPHHGLSELGAEVVTHLSQGWGEKGETKKVGINASKPQIVVIVAFPYVYHTQTQR